MWSGDVINTRDGCDLMNVVFQYMHLNRIIVGLEMFSLFRNLHRKYREIFITNAIWAIRSFQIHEEKL
jgi:hypothetical protein